MESSHGNQAPFAFLVEACSRGEPAFQVLTKKLSFFIWILEVKLTVSGIWKIKKMFLLLSHIVMAIYKAEYINKKVNFGELQRLFFH